MTAPPRGNRPLRSRSTGRTNPAALRSAPLLCGGTASHLPYMVGVLRREACKYAHRALQSLAQRHRRGSSIAARARAAQRTHWVLSARSLAASTLRFAGNTPNRGSTSARTVSGHRAEISPERIKPLLVLGGTAALLLAPAACWWRYFPSHGADCHRSKGWTGVSTSTLDRPEAIAARFLDASAGWRPKRLQAAIAGPLVLAANERSAWAEIPGRARCGPGCRRGSFGLPIIKPLSEGRGLCARLQAFTVAVHGCPAVTGSPYSSSSPQRVPGQPRHAAALPIMIDTLKSAVFYLADPPPTAGEGARHRRITSTSSRNREVFEIERKMRAKAAVIQRTTPR